MFQRCLEKDTSLGHELVLYKVKRTAAKTNSNYFAKTLVWFEPFRVVISFRTTQYGVSTHRSEISQSHQQSTRAFGASSYYYALFPSLCSSVLCPLDFPQALEDDHLVGLVVSRPPREWKIPGSNPACDGIFSGSSHSSDFKIGTPVATLPCAWRYRVSAGTG